MAARSLALERISVRRLRNLSLVELSFGPRFNVIAGDNGQGKTNLLDAIYTLATSRSFRGGRADDAVQHGADIASVRGEFSEDGLRREQSVGLRKGLRAVRIDGKRPKTLVDYASRTPVVVFHPADTQLPAGGGAERRRLLDRVAFHLVPGAPSAIESYRRASRTRQRALEERGTRAKDLPDWEALMVTHGREVGAARALAAARLVTAAESAFARIAPAGVRLEAVYVAGAPPDAAAYARALEESRPKDAARGWASVGPHRDELSLVLGGHPVRGVASQGQQRLVVLALKVAEIEAIESAKEVRPLLLLDDVSSELDRERTTALFTFVGEQVGQVFLTTTRPELIDTSAARPDARQDYAVTGGEIRLV